MVFPTSRLPGVAAAKADIRNGCISGAWICRPPRCRSSSVAVAPAALVQIPEWPEARVILCLIQARREPGLPGEMEASAVMPVISIRTRRAAREAEPEDCRAGSRKVRQDKPEWLGQESAPAARLFRLPKAATAAAAVLEATWLPAGLASRETAGTRTRRVVEAPVLRGPMRRRRRWPAATAWPATSSFTSGFKERFEEGCDELRHCPVVAGRSAAAVACRHRARPGAAAAAQRQSRFDPGERDDGPDCLARQRRRDRGRSPARQPEPRPAVVQHHHRPADGVERLKLAAGFDRKRISDRSRKSDDRTILVESGERTPDALERLGVGRARRHHIVWGSCPAKPAAWTALVQPQYRLAGTVERHRVGAGGCAGHRLRQG